MKQKFFFISVICCLFILFSGCKKEPGSPSGQNDPPQKSGLNNGNGLQVDGEPYEEIILGNQLKNAYSVANMTIAYDSLSNSRSNLFSSTPLLKNLTISTTHLYICFKPQDTTEYNYLIDESGLTLFHYPLDYEIVQQGLYYIRSGSQPGDLPWLYTTIPVGQAKSIQVAYDVLEKCFIPTDLVSDELANASDLTETMAMLELEALKLTDNITQEEYENAIYVSRGAKCPTGYIKVRNTSSNNLEGVKKVKVRVHNIVKWCEIHTDENGYYKIPLPFLTNVHYTTIFENATGFKIWGNLAFLAPANFSMGWYSNSGHNRNIETNSEAWLWSTVNNAAYIYREKMCPAFNITKPAFNLRFWTLKLNGKWGGCAPMTHRVQMQTALFTTFVNIFSIYSLMSYLVFVLPDVFILQNYTTTYQCYSNVFHELSHASHYEKAGSGYWLNYISGTIANGGYGDGSKPLDGFIGVGEMWGNYLGWKCMNKQTILGPHFGTVELGGTNFDDWYKPQIMEDLEEICNLTPKQIYDCLDFSVTSHALFKAKLISKYPSLQQTINNIFTYHEF